MTDANIAVDFDFNDMLRAHIESGADVTVAYAEQEIPAELIHAGAHRGHVLQLKLEDGRVKRIFMNPEESGKQNLSMNIYIMEREALIEKIHAALYAAIPILSVISLHRAWRNITSARTSMKDIMQGSAD